MSIAQTFREVDEDDCYREQVVQAYGECESTTTPENWKDYTESIRDYLCRNADQCPVAYTFDGKPYYNYQPEPIGKFKRISIIFSVEEDDEGEYVVLESFRGYSA